MINTRSLLASFFLIIGLISHARAQHVVTEGRAIYAASYDIPADQLLNYGTLPTQIIAYFRGDSSAAIVNQGNAIIKGVTVIKSNFHSMIIDIPAASKKIYVVLTPAEIAEENATNPQFTVKPGTEKDIINGYKCTKSTITDTKTGISYDLWLTNDISIAPNSLSRALSGFGGVPVQFVTFNHGIKISAELLGIEEDVIPQGFFSSSKDYQTMSYQDLKKMTSGK